MAIRDYCTKIITETFLTLLDLYENKKVSITFWRSANISFVI